MSQHHNDEFDDKRLSDLYKQSATEKPSDHISRGILSSAKQHARSNKSGWGPIANLISILSSSRSLAFTAVMVIGISIILQIQFDQPEQIVPQGISEFSNGAPISKMKSRSAESITEPETFSESMDSVSDTELTPSESSLKKQKVRTPQPEKPVKKTYKPTFDESNRKIAEEAKQRMLERDRLMQQHSQQKKERQEKQMMQTPESAFSPAPIASPLLEMTPSQLTTTADCENLTNKACLSSANCILATQENTLICRIANDHCEKDFVQFHMHEKQCELKDNCQYKKSDCDCGVNETCTCDNNSPPSCELIEDAE